MYMKFNGDVSIVRELAFIVVVVMPGQLAGCFCIHGSRSDPEILQLIFKNLLPMHLYQCCFSLLKLKLKYILVRQIGY